MKNLNRDDFRKSFYGLFLLEDEDFVRSLFRELLGRDPDHSGMNHYLEKLRTKNDRMQIVSDIFSSREAEQRPQYPLVSRHVIRYRLARFWQFRSLSRAIKRYITNPHKISGQGYDYIPHHAQSSAMVPEYRRDTEFNDSLIGKINEIRDNVSPDSLIGKINEIKDSISRLEYSINNAGPVVKDEVLGDGGTRYLFNLSTSNHWRRHAVGIVRVERGLANYLNRFKNVEFCIWDANDKSLKGLKTYQLTNILSEEWCGGNNGMASYDPAQLPRLAVDKKDVYISLGLDWDHAPTADVVEYLGRFGAGAVLACHDTVPVQFPEFLVRSELDQEFRQHLVEMAHGATQIWTNSGASERDLRKFWKEAGLEDRLPNIFTVPLASYSASSSLPHLGPRDRAIMNDVFGKGDYVLYVSSFEPRKNHKLILDIWRELWLERGADCPQFVPVGMAGWGSNELLDRVPRMPAYIGNKINWLQHVSDDLLAHLYHNSAFTVFPSLYEGWGLAATEAMAFGKVSVVSNNSSLPEATQHLMPSYHPLDFPGWKGEIERLLDDLPYRRALEKKISDEYKNSTWDDFGDAFCGHLVRGN
jgi:glycosyltransferase involved in cell wall biosynthesis